MDTNKTDKTKEPKPLLSSNVKWVIGTLVGIGTGLTKFVTDVRSEFYENMYKGPDFKPKLEAHGLELGRLKEQRRNGKIDTPTFIKQFHDQKNQLAKEIDSFTEELGIVSNDFLGSYTKGTRQRFQMLSENTRIPLVFSAITTTVIGFAGTSMFMTSLANRKKIDTIAKHSQTDPNQSQR